MKRLRVFKKNTDANLTAYVMILFGMIVMLYLFGFTNMWSIYTGTEEGGVVLTEGVTDNPNTDEEAYAEETTGITDPTLNIGNKIFNMMTNSIYSILLSGATIVGTIAFLWFFRKNSAVWQYAIPIILLVVLNVFVFPISALQGDMAPMDALFADTAAFSFTLILIIFFNLFYILAVLEFVRGGGST